MIEATMINTANASIPRDDHSKHSRIVPIPATLPAFQPLTRGKISLLVDVHKPWSR